MDYDNPDKVPPVWEVGDVILGKYEVRQIFTGGGMGLVYRVHHRDWDIDLAVKSPRPEFFKTEQQIENFEREAETWVNLGLHPNIVSCYYVRRLGGIPWIFAEFVEGGTLSEWIHTKRLYEGSRKIALARIIDMAIQIAWGLNHAHEKGLVHQDIKPGNILMMPDGTAKVSDFGLANARRVSAESTTVAPHPGQSVLVPGSGLMTPEYASPEQLRGEHLSRKTDIWSWAVSLLEMLLGELTWSNGLAAPAVLEELDDGRLDEECVALLDRCFGSPSMPRLTSFDPVIQALTSFYTSRFGTYPRSAPQEIELRADSLNNRGVSLLDLGDSEKALATFEKALDVNPRHVDAHYNHGLLLWRTGKITDVAFVRRLQELCQSQPQEWRAAYHLGLVQMERRDVEEAVGALENAARLTNSLEVRCTLDHAHAAQTTAASVMRVFEGHEKNVSAVCLTADERLALSGSWDSTLRLWDISTGRCLRNFVGHTDAVTSICLSSDDRLALSGSKDKTMKLWNLSSGTCLLTFENSSPIHSVFLSRDNRWALSAGGYGGLGSGAPDFRQPEIIDCTVKLWDLGSGCVDRVFEGHRNIVTSVCLSADGQCAVSASYDGTIRVWGTNHRVLEGHKNVVRTVSLDSDMQFAISGGFDRTVRLWNIATGECVRVLECDSDVCDFVNSVCMSPEAQWAISASGYYVDFDSAAKPRLRFWNLATGQCVRSYECDASQYSVCMSSDQLFALSGGYDGKLRLWDISGLTKNAKRCHFELSTITKSNQAADAAACFSNHIEQGYMALNAQKWDAALDHANAARAVPGYDVDDRAITLRNAVGLRSLRKSLRGVWPLWRFNKSDARALLVCLSPDGSRIVTIGDNNVLRIWNTATGECLDIIEAEKNELGDDSDIRALRLSRDNKIALIGTGYDASEMSITWQEPMLQLWDLEMGTAINTLWTTSRSLVTDVSFSPDERWALAITNYGSLSVVNLAKGDSRDFIRRIGNYYTACFNADGTLILSGGGPGYSKKDPISDYILLLWDIARGNCVQTFLGHTDAVQSVKLSGDGQWAISGGKDRTLRLWDVSTGKCLRIFEGHPSSITSVCFCSNKRWAVSASSREIKLWDLLEGCVATLETECHEVFLSPDNRWLVSGPPLRLWELEWEFEAREPVDWDEGAGPHLANFLTLNTPNAIQLPKDREPTDEEITLALTRSGKSSWNEDDFQKLLYTLACAGYGWLRPEGVRRELEAMAAI